jgi:hypothetical protein
MKIKTVTFYKELKKNLGNFSNLTAAYGMTVEVSENEKVDNSAIWDEINRQISLQASSIDPSWITKDDKPKGYFINKKYGKNIQD